MITDHVHALAAHPCPKPKQSVQHSASCASLKHFCLCIDQPDDVDNDTAQRHAQRTRRCLSQLWIFKLRVRDDDFSFPQSPHMHSTALKYAQMQETGGVCTAHVVAFVPDRQSPTLFYLFDLELAKLTGHAAVLHPNQPHRTPQPLTDEARCSASLHVACGRALDKEQSRHKSFCSFVR